MFPTTTAVAGAATTTAPSFDDFRAYLQTSLRDPFTLNLEGYSLLAVINACVKAKSRLMPNYGSGIGCLVYNLKALEREYRISLQPVQVTDVFWGYFIAFCQSRGLKSATISVVCQQLRSILNWAAKYNATLSPTYNEFRLHKEASTQIALTADDVSRIAYFDIDRYYADRRSDFRDTMHRVRDMFVLSCNLYQRHSDMVRIGPPCFERNIFTISQQKTGNRATVNIDLFSVDAKTTYRILDRYNHEAPYKANIGNYNHYLHGLMRDIGFTEEIRIEERRDGKMTAIGIPKWKLISSHTARRTAITIAVLRGLNVHAIKRCSGHTDLRSFELYVRDE